MNFPKDLPPNLYTLKRTRYENKVEYLRFDGASNKNQGESEQESSLITKNIRSFVLFAELWKNPLTMKKIYPI